MGRKIPSANNEPSQSFHQAPCVPVLLAEMAAIMAIVSLLCGVRSKRKPDSPHSTHKQADNNTNSPPIEAAHKQGSAEVIELIEPELDIESQRRKTPGKLFIRHTFSSTNLLKKSASTRNLAKNLSTKMQRSMSMAGRDLQDRMNNKGGKLKPEDSIWMKTIILGEKCRVEDGEEAIIYERKGNKIAAYHPKKYSSFINHNAIRSQDVQSRESTDFSE